MLILYYLSPLLPRADWLRHARVWEWLRTNHNPVRWVRADGSELQKMPHEETGPPVMYAIAPHSVYAEHVTLAMALHPVFSEVRVICTSLLFWIPMARECAAMAGCVRGNMADIMRELDAGHSVASVPEGLRGRLYPGESVRVLRGIEGESGPRLGFVRAAITALKGCRLIPVYVRGTEQLYDVWLPWPWFQRLMLRRFMYPWPVLHVGWMGTFWPKAGALEFVVGAEVPTKGRDVETVHQEFCSRMEEIR